MLASTFIECGDVRFGHHWLLLSLMLSTVGRHSIIFVLLCGFMLLLVCGDIGTFVNFLTYYMLIAVGKGLSSGSYSIHAHKMIAYLSLSCGFSLARYGVRYSFLSDKYIVNELLE